jgi:YgiT-type zinc finger domain-containing protein
MDVKFFLKKIKGRFRAAFCYIVYMTCFMCKGTMRDGISVFTADMGGCVVIVRDVPSSVCGQCGDVSYSDDVARRLERIVQDVKDSAVTEIAVLSYSEKDVIGKRTQVGKLAYA